MPGTPKYQYVNGWWLPVGAGGSPTTVQQPGGQQPEPEEQAGGDEYIGADGVRRRWVVKDGYRRQQYYDPTYDTWRDAPRVRQSWVRNAATGGYTLDYDPQYYLAGQSAAGYGRHRDPETRRRLAEAGGERLTLEDMTQEQRDWIFQHGGSGRWRRDPWGNSFKTFQGGPGTPFPGGGDEDEDGMQSPRFMQPLINWRF